MAYIIYNMIANEPFLSVASSQIAAPNIYNIYFRCKVITRASQAV